MATASWSSPLRHDSDIEFRTWGLELSTKLALVGLVQSPDTGQIDWSTVVRPAVNTTAGYQIWEFTDALQAAAPIFVKFEFGTGGGANTPRILVTVGTGSNGTGTLTGAALTAARLIHLTTANSFTATTPRQSFCCHTDGFLGLSWKIAASTAEGLLIISRTINATGAATNLGAMVVWGSASGPQLGATQALRFAAPAIAYGVSISNQAAMALGFLPQAQTGTLVGADIQAALAFTITPRFAPIIGVVGVLDAEMGVGNTFSVAMVGTTPHTYIALSLATPFGPLGTASGGPKCAFLWE